MRRKGNETNMQSRSIRRTERRSPKRAGAAIVEAALVLPFVIMFIMGLFEYGRYFLMVHVCSNAVSAGASYACKHTSNIIINGTTYQNRWIDVNSAVNSAMGTQQLANTTVSAFLSDGLGNVLADSAGNNPGLFSNAGVGQYITVTLSGTYTFVPAKFLYLPSTTTVTFQATRRSEAN
jgi:Flp pilus assembly protein TadG